jgi:hypothetical protein
MRIRRKENQRAIAGGSTNGKDPLHQSFSSSTSGIYGVSKNAETKDKKCTEIPLFLPIYVEPYANKHVQNNRKKKITLHAHCVQRLAPRQSSLYVVLLSLILAAVFLTSLTHSLLMG